MYSENVSPRFAHLVEPEAGERPAARTTRRRSRAKPRPPRPRAVILAELKGLGGLVLEQALLDASAQPLPSLMEWADRLAGELAVEGVGRPATYRDLLRAIVAVNKRAEAQDVAA
jgi:hypothetical protein